MLPETLDKVGVLVEHLGACFDLAPPMNAEGSIDEVQASLLRLATAAHAIGLTQDALLLAQHDRWQSVGLLCRSQIETVVLGHWLVQEPVTSLRRLAGNHAWSVQNLVDSNPDVFRREGVVPPAVLHARELGTDPADGQRLRIEQLAAKVGLEALYRVAYRFESTYSEHGLGSC